MPRTFEDYRRERRARIAGWLSQGTEAEIVTGLCETWVRDLLNSGREPRSRHDLSHLPPELNLAARLSDAGLRAYADALAWQLDRGEGTEPGEAALISHALAVASGRTFAAHGPDKLHWIGDLVATVDTQSWDAFADSAAEALSDDADQRSAFVQFLTGIVEEANEAPDRVVEIPPRNASMASIVEQFVRTGGFQDVWQADLTPILFRWSYAFDILRRAEPERFLEMIDELPHPALVKACLNSRALIEDPKEVLRLLRLARASFDAEGRWLRNGMAAILLLQLASVQLLSAPNTPDGDARFVQSPAALAGSQAAKDAEELAKGVAQYQEAVDGLLDVLFARSDAVELGWHWLENILRQLPRHRASGRRQNHSSYRMIDQLGILVCALSSRLSPRRTQEVWIADVQPLFRQYRAVAVLSVSAFSATAGNLDVGAVAQGLLKHNRFELTRASEFIQLPGAPLRTIPGYALARIPNVASWFTKTWSGLRFAREQAWRRARGRAIDANPAEIMGLWGLGTLEALAADETQLDDARMMWHALEAVFREVRLVEPRLSKDFWCLALARLFACWPRLFVSATSVNGAKSTFAEPTGLNDLLAPYVGISDDFMGIVVALHQAGIGETMLDRAVVDVGHDLLRMIRRFLETARGLKDVRLWNQDWVAVLGRIEKAVAALRSSNERTPARS